MKNITKTQIFDARRVRHPQHTRFPATAITHHYFSKKGFYYV